MTASAMVGSRRRWRPAPVRDRAPRRPLRLPQGHGRHRLLGVGADSDLYAARDAFDREFGVIMVPATGHASVLLSVDRQVDGPVDPADSSLGWTAALAGRAAASQPDLSGCAVGLLDDPARPGQAITLQLTWCLGGGGRLDPAATAVELGARLPAVIDSVRRSRAGNAEPLSAAELIRRVAVAHRRPDPDAWKVSEGDWADVMPRRCEQAWDRLVHGAAASASWSLAGSAGAVAPGQLLSSVLPPRAESARVPWTTPVRARITVLHRPIRVGSPDDARAVTDSPADWTGLPSCVRHPEPDQAPAVPLRTTVLLTLTAGTTELDGAGREALARVAPCQRPWVRRLYGSQAAAFAAALPVGVLLEEHAVPPGVVHEPDA